MVDSRSINKTLENYPLMKSFLNDVLNDIMRLTGAESGSLFLSDATNGELVLDSFYNSTPLPVKDIRRRIGEGVAGKIAQNRTAVLVRNIESDSRFVRNGFTHYRTNSFICVPLFISHSLVGVISIADKSNGEPFSDNDLKSAEILCRYASKIVEVALNVIITNQEKEALSQQKNTLEKYASVGKLAAGVVHEINNPLDGIIRYANIMLNQMEHNSAGKEYLLEIRKGLHRIANITKSLLNFSHQVNNETARMKKYIHLHDAIEDALGALSGRIHDRIQIKRNFDRTIPKIADLGLDNIILNLLKNAIDAMPEGGILEISTECQESHLLLKVKDTGSGIPQEIKNRIFEPFFTTKPKDKGTGLGLSICSELVKNFGGNIEVESSPNQGTTFSVLIPNKYMNYGQN